MRSARVDAPGGARIRRPAAVALLMSLAAISGGAAASDSAAELPTGGLMLTKSDDIETRAEELYISPRQVRVSYRFINASPQDVKTLVAFPMPDVTVGDAAVDVPVPSDDPQNLLGFSTLVDGAPVKARVVQKVFARGIDRTADLERMKVPLAPHLRSTDMALARVLPGDGEELTRNGLTAVEEYSVGRGMRKQLSPRWTLKTTYLWEQTFPAGREVAIDLRYKPSVGRSVQTALGDPAAMKDERLKAYVRSTASARISWMRSPEPGRLPGRPTARRSPRSASPICSPRRATGRSQAGSFAWSWIRAIRAAS